MMARVGISPTSGPPSIEPGKTPHMFNLKYRRFDYVRSKSINIKGCRN